MNDATRQLTNLALDALERREASACIIPIPGTNLFVAIGLPQEIVRLICTKGDDGGCLRDEYDHAPSGF